MCRHQEELKVQNVVRGAPGQTEISLHLSRFVSLTEGLRVRMGMTGTPTAGNVNVLAMPANDVSIHK